MSKVNSIAEAIGLDMIPCGYFVAIMMVKEDNREGMFERTDKGGAAQYGFVVAAGSRAEKEFPWNGDNEPLTGCKVMIPKTGGQVYKECAIVDIRDVRMYAPAEVHAGEFVECIKDKSVV